MLAKQDLQSFWEDGEEVERKIKQTTVGITETDSLNGCPELLKRFRFQIELQISATLEKWQNMPMFKTERNRFL